MMSETRRLKDATLLDFEQSAGCDSASRNNRDGFFVKFGLPSKAVSAKLSAMISAF